MDFIQGYGAAGLMRMSFAAMLAALFLQSSLDKIINWKAEKEYLTGHFAKSIFRGWVPVLLPLITVIELAAGACSALGFFLILFRHDPSIGQWGMIFGVKAIFLLFLGQRIAKDYAGAASLIPYFLMCVAGLYFFLA